MTASRLCPDCKIFTEDNDYCSQCGKLINLEKIRASELKKRTEEIQNIQPDELDRWIDKFKHSRFILVRMTYTVLHSIWFVFMAIVSFFMFLTAAMPG